MSADVLLSRLDKVRRTGPGRWVARCPAHDDCGPSLAVRELDDGRLLVHCFAGCPVDDVLSAIGMSLSDMFPEPLTLTGLKRERRPFPAADVLRCLGFETLVVLCGARSVLNGNPLRGAAHERLLLAARRISAALDAAGVHHG